jgi:hypothetical protein
VHDASAWNAARARCQAYIEREYSEATVLEPYLLLLDRADGR